MTNSPSRTLEHPDHEPRVVQCARIIATVAHQGQVDKAGERYILHPKRVAQRVKAAGGSDEAVAAAWLHDVLEDTDVDMRTLLDAGIPAMTVGAVALLTRWPEWSPEHYYGVIKGDPIALLVKEHDIADNTDPERLAMLDDKTRERLLSKYAKAREVLGLTENAHSQQEDQ